MWKYGLSENKKACDFKKSIDMQRNHGFVSQISAIHVIDKCQRNFRQTACEGFPFGLGNHQIVFWRLM